MTFRATFLGHHGWLFEGAEGRLLVDPILTPRWGFTDAVELRAFPPRRFDLGRFPPVDAVLLTHEHEGHFEIPSLHLVDRAVPVLLSERSSVATRDFLREMGFEVRLLSPERTVPIADLVLVPMTANQVNARADEWDVVPFLVHDRAGDGSFFTQVDMRANESMWQIAMSHVKRPGLWSYTNNHNQWDFLYAWRYPPARNLYRLTHDILAYHRQMEEGWAPPAALLLSGGGFVFGGARSWLTEAVFPLDSLEVAEALLALLPGQDVRVPVPGQSFVMTGGEIARVEESREFVEAMPRAEWPRRTGRPPEWLEAYDPATGRKSLAEGEADLLSAELDRFAEHLYATSLFRRLYSLSVTDVKGRRPTIAVTLRNGEDGGAFVYEYEPQACRFRPVTATDPVSEYLAVYECWASDMLALLRGEMASTALLFARSRHWNAAPDVLGFDLDHFLVEYAHPLRHPERFAKLYREILATLPEPPTRIRKRA